MSSKYFVGDRLVAHCLLPESHPPAVLQWYINDVTADIKHLSRQYTVTRNTSQYQYLSQLCGHSSALTAGVDH